MKHCLLAVILASVLAAAPVGAEEAGSVSADRGQTKPVEKSVRARDDQIQSTRLRKKIYGEERVRPEPEQLHGTEEDGELVTEPMTGSSAQAEPPEPTPTPVMLPVSHRMIRNYSVHASETPAASRMADGTFRNFAADQEELPEPETEDDGRELKTEPLFVRTGPVSNEVRSYRAELDRGQIHLDESFTLLVEIVVPDLKSLSDFQLPAMPDFSLINMYQSDVITTAEQKVWKVRSQRFVYIARRPGVFTIPAIGVIYQGRRYQTQPLSLSVEGARSGFAYRQGVGKTLRMGNIVQAAPDAFGNAMDSDDFAASISTEKVYVNQQLVLKVHLQFVADKDTSMKYTPPALTGFLIEELPQANTEENVSGGQRRYVEHNYRTALFPVLSGNLTVGAALVRFYGQAKERSRLTEPLNITVLPLPPDPQAKNQEAESRLVGRYQMSAELESRRTEVNAPVHLELRLWGEGNIREAPEPVIDHAGDYRVYLEDRKEKISLSHEKVQGERTYRYLVVFDKTGVAKLGQARVRYFNPQAIRWESADTWIPEITVLPRQAPAPNPDQEHHAMGWKSLRLRPNHGGATTLRLQNDGPLESLWFWLAQAFGPLMIAMAFLGRYLYQRSQADLLAVRTRRAYPQFRKTLNQIAAFIHKGDIQSFYSTLAKAISEYLAAKFGVPAAYIGVERLPEYFERFQVPEQIGGQFKVALMACEYVRYAAVVLPTRDMRALHHDLRQTVKHFETWWEKTHGRKSRKRPTSALLIPLLLLAWQAYAGGPELNFWRGNAFAEKGEYASAEAEYRKVLADRVNDPDVYYNLGNAYLKQGKLGPAILSYERGLLLAPRNADLRHNLNQAASLVQTPAVNSGNPKWLRGMIAVFRSFTVGELAFAASAAYYVAMIVFFAMILWPARFSRLRNLGLAAGVLALFLAAWCAARSWEPQWYKRAVVLTSKADVYVRPYPRADVLFTMHEGTRVEIKHEEEVWIEIRMATDRHGWVERSALGFIE